MAATDIPQPETHIPLSLQGEEALDEPRLVVESGVEGRIAQMIAPAVKDLGYRLVRIRLSGMNGATLQIMAERADGTMTVEDCEALSKTISPLLDLEDPIGKAYHLEVSSPGIDRLLVRYSDFVRAVGCEAKVELKNAVLGRKRLRGWLLGIKDEQAGLRLLQKLEDGAEEIWFPLRDLVEAKLVLNDALIKQSLKAGTRMESSKETE